MARGAGRTRLQAYLDEQASGSPASGGQTTTPLRKPTSSRRRPAQAMLVELQTEQAGALRLALPVEDAARALGIGKTTAWEKIDRGELPARWVPGKKRVVVLVEDLQAYVNTFPPYRARASSDETG